MRVQHGGQEQGVAAGHHVKGGQWEQIFLDVAAAVHHLEEASECVDKVLVSVAIPAGGEEHLRSLISKMMGL